jgi:hypothetical protein
MLKTVWKRREEYSVAQVDVYSGPAFLWTEVVCRILKFADKRECLNRGTFFSTQPISTTLRSRFWKHWPVAMHRQHKCWGDSIFDSNERNAMLVPQNNADSMATAVQTILNRPETSSQLSQNAWEKAKEFDWAVGPSPMGISLSKSPLSIKKIFIKRIIS